MADENILPVGCQAFKVTRRGLLAAVRSGEKG
jgi:hypothetical protein